MVIDIAVVHPEELGADLAYLRLSAIPFFLSTVYDSFFETHLIGSSYSPKQTSVYSAICQLNEANEFFPRYICCDLSPSCLSLFSGVGNQLPEASFKYSSLFFDAYAKTLDVRFFADPLFTSHLESIAKQRVLNGSESSSHLDEIVNQTSAYLNMFVNHLWGASENLRLASK